MRASLGLVLVAACGGRPPPTAPPPAANVAAPKPAEPAPRDAAPAACSWNLPHPWPVPSTGRPIDLLCDLPDRVVTVAADSVDEGNVHGTAWSVDRATGRVTAAALLPSSDGCGGMMKCHFATTAPGMRQIWTHTDERIISWGQVGDSDQTMTACRRHDETAIALCVTAEHSAALDFACNPPTATGTDVALVVDVYDAARGREDDAGFEQPTTELPAQLVAVPADGRTWSYRGSGVALSFDLGDPPSGSLQLGDGAVEPCLGFALYRDPRN